MVGTNSEWVTRNSRDEFERSGRGLEFLHHDDRAAEPVHRARPEDRSRVGLQRRRRKIDAAFAEADSPSEGDGAVSRLLRSPNATLAVA